MVALLNILSYAAGLATLAFVILSLANGLLWLAELIEEHSKAAKVVGIRIIYAIILLHAALYLTEQLPFHLVAFSVVCHIIYLQNFSSSWPYISLFSPSFILSCVVVIADHFLWFFYFARKAQEARSRARTRYHGGGQLVKPTDGVHTFWETTTFFGVCVWFIPMFLFLSLSANDNALPVVSKDNSTPHYTQPTGRMSLFKTVFSFLPKSFLPRRFRVQEAPIIAPPHSPLLSPANIALPSTPGAGGGWTDLGSSPLPSPNLGFARALDSLPNNAQVSLRAPPRRSVSTPGSTYPQNVGSTSPRPRRPSSRISSGLGLGFGVDENDSTGRRRVVMPAEKMD